MLFLAGNDWLQQVIDLPVGTTQVHFVGYKNARSADITGDIALDDIGLRIISNDNRGVTTTTTAATTTTTTTATTTTTTPSTTTASTTVPTTTRTTVGKFINSERDLKVVVVY